MTKTKKQDNGERELDAIIEATGASVNANDVILGLPEDDETPAGVKLSHVQSWVTRLGLIDAELAAVETALDDARTKRKAILKAREEHIHTRPDEQLPSDTPLFNGLAEDEPAWCVSVQVNLDRGGAAAVAVMTAASSRLSGEDFAAWVKDFVDEAEDFA